MTSLSPLSMASRLGARTVLLLGLSFSLLSVSATADEHDRALPFDIPIVTGEVELGGRTTWGDDDEGKLLEYRDFDAGILGQFRLLAENEEGTHFLRLRGSNVGYDDQRYELEAGRYGRYRVDLFYGELPHVFSTHARTLYQRTGSHQFRLPAGVQTRIANATDASAQLATELLAAEPVDLAFRQIEGGGGAEYRVSEKVRLFGRYHLRDRKGSRPMAIQFGNPGDDFNLFASPVDDDTHRVDAGIELATSAYSFGLEYSGSFYRNELRSVIVDNPLVDIEAADAAIRGRSSVDPDNSAHSLSASGFTRLPLPFPAQVSANVTYGLRLQDDEFLPYTINSAIASPGLPEGSLDGEIHTLLANVVATARPVPKLNLKARYRVYHYYDETDALRLPSWVRNDDEARTDAFRSVRNDYTRQDVDLSGSYRFTSDLKTRIGYDVEAWHRSDDRQVEDLVEHGPSVALDWRVHARASLRASYAFKDRDGDGYDTLSFFESKLDPADFAAFQAAGVTEISGLRKFDQANRQLHRITLTGHLLPCDRTDITVDAGWRDIDYNDSDYGLTEQRSWHVGIDGFYQAHERVGVGLWYNFEETFFEQQSRWRPRNFIPPITLVDDPRNDWQSESESRFHSLGARIDLAVIRERLDVELGYQFHLGEEMQDNSAAPGFVGTGGVGVGTDGGAAFAYPDVEETLHVFTGSATVHVTDRLDLRGQYRYEHFDLEDYRTDSLGPFRGGMDVFLGNTIGDYDVHILVMSASIKL